MESRDELVPREVICDGRREHTPRSRSPGAGARAATPEPAGPVTDAAPEPAIARPGATLAGAAARSVAATGSVTSASDRRGLSVALAGVFRPKNGGYRQDMHADLDVQFPADAGAPEAARRSIERLRADLLPATFDETTLLVSELVTNSVRHGGLAWDQPIRVRAAVGDRSLRVAVTDPGEGFDVSAIDPPNGHGGWGLRVLDRLASAWGVEEDRATTTVWFELGFAPGERG